jgi:hypothetical protein
MDGPNGPGWLLARTYGRWRWRSAADLVQMLVVLGVATRRIR